MENTTDPITQFVNDNVEGEPLFKGYVVVELRISSHLVILSVKKVTL